VHAAGGGGGGSFQPQMNADERDLSVPIGACILSGWSVQ
jgi:hypothetical protein